MKKNIKLPKNEIFVLPNMDKLNHELPDMENLANLPNPCRVILFYLLNILLKKYYLKRYYINIIYKRENKTERWKIN